MCGRRPPLPPFLYENHIAPFLRFQAPLPNMLFAFGGRNRIDGPLNTVEMLDTWNGEWKTCPPMSCRRAGGAAAALPDGRIIVVGGYDGRGFFKGLLSECEIYDPRTEEWSSEENAVPSLHRARWGHSCALFQGKVWAVGGCSRQDGVTPSRAGPQHMTTLRSCEVYDATQNCWSQGPSLQVARSGCRAVALSCGKRLVVVGGLESVFSDPETQATVEIFDASVGLWQLLDAQLKLPTTNAGIAPLGDNRIFVAGGVNSTSAQVYHIVAPCDRDVLVFGGQREDESHNDERDYKKYMPTEDMPSLLCARMGCQAVVMQLPGKDRQFPVCDKDCVVLVGGEKFQTPPGSPNEWQPPLASRDLRQLRCMTGFDLESGAWQEADGLPAMAQARATAALCLGVGHVRSTRVTLRRPTF